MKKCFRRLLKGILAMGCCLILLFMMSNDVMAMEPFISSSCQKNGTSFEVLFSYLDYPVALKCDGDVNTLFEYTGEAITPYSLTWHDYYNLVEDGSEPAITPKYMKGDNEVSEIKEVGNYVLLFYYGDKKLDDIAFPVVVTYAITYDANGGSGSMDMKYLAQGETAVVIDECSFTAPEGKVFDGWAFDTAGTNKISDNTLTLTENKTLFAIWKDNGGDGNSPAPNNGSQPTLDEEIRSKINEAANNPVQDIILVNFGESDSTLNISTLKALKESGNDILCVSFILEGTRYSFYIPAQMIEIEDDIQEYGPKKLLYYNQTEKQDEAMKYFEAVEGVNNYQIQPNDTLSGIALKFNTSVGSLAQINGIKNVNEIIAGEKLKVQTTPLMAKELLELEAQVLTLNHMHKASYITIIK